MNDLLQFDFNVPIEKLKTIRIKKNDHAIQREPRLRQSLILAYQIEQIIEDKLARDFTEVADWLSMTKARLSQIMSLLNLAPSIQEEILLTDSPKIYQSTVDTIQYIALEIDWNKQSILWKDLTRDCFVAEKRSSQ